MSRTFNHAICKYQRRHGTLLPVTTELPRCLLLFRQFPKVSYQFLYIVRLNLRAESRHLSFALGDHFSQLLIGLLLHFRGAQILRMECLAGCGAATAIGRVTLDAVRLKKPGGFGLGLQCGWPGMQQPMTAEIKRGKSALM